MDELSVVLKARKFIKTVAPHTIPVSVQEYADQVGAVIQKDSDLKQMNLVGRSKTMGNTIFLSMPKTATSAKDSLFVMNWRI